jgi:hypothetical protein
MCPAPVTTLAPPVPSARLSAAGFVARKFVGAAASSRKPAAIAALASSTGSPAPAARTSVTSRDAARCA